MTAARSSSLPCAAVSGPRSAPRRSLAHAFNEVAFDEQRPPTPIAALARLAPVPGSLALRALAAALELSPVTQPTPDDPRANPPNPHALVSAPGGTSAISGLRALWANPGLKLSLVERLVFFASAPPLDSSGVGPSRALSSLATVHCDGPDDQGACGAGAAERAEHA
ncbi:hypothetical protein Rhopal_006417-T1 [Rhodotorula paludigena]|uniref:Uncharacterized protein n=1 Tax=Rhodotorula paludigena TaxID=86838 RepID=A0AAV5GVX4_9BASI|nr:hypothetical protein Rhopal_006417-T1 [Rhodotorula paludigena]